MLRQPHAFHLFLHPVHRILHARLTPRAAAALRLEVDAIASSCPDAVLRLRKLLLLAPPHHRLRLEHIRLRRRRRRTRLGAAAFVAIEGDGDAAPTDRLRLRRRRRR
ncbi:hypothetical protein BRADI_4g13684v3 [Brachypodium distachyon]|uniref:PORR domain-containing protein n=1 Tax=Brachypodium distachyon TaxID=15368 RepID=A0A0Q3EJD8_BRADI|nr:hypothetical protein BRADI_4g13684v3 [Brachypodium distachyon]